MSRQQESESEEEDEGEAVGDEDLSKVSAGWTEECKLVRHHYVLMSEESDK